MDLGNSSIDLNQVDMVCIEEADDDVVETSMMCLIGKVFTNKTFNAYGLLETMKKALNPSMGLTAKDIGKNLFSF
ncbi:hypothetical protein ACS0TY_020811 [Phlomoides rotata]